MVGVLTSDLVALRLVSDLLDWLVTLGVWCLVFWVLVAVLALLIWCNIRS